MFGIIQIVLVIVLIAAIIVYFGKIRHAKKSLIAGLILCAVVSAGISDSVVDIIPLPTDKVIVTATGEKNEAASSNEAYITNLIVGGEEYELTTPSEGKWFWKGDCYMWRNENDTRQPECTTRSITLDMPYGCGRSIQFGLSKWNGIVEVSYGGDTKSYDLFKADDVKETVLYAPIPDTGFFALYGIKLLRLGLFLLIVVLLMAHPVYAAVKFEYETIKTFWEKHWDKLAYIVIAFSCFVFMFNLGKEGSLWFDEVWLVGVFLTDNFGYNNLVTELFQNIWVKCMPYGQEYLLTLSELLVAFSIYTFGLIGDKLKGKRLGVILAALCAASGTIIYQCGIEFRHYPFSLFFSALTVYMFIKKQNELGREKTLTLILYGLCLALLMDSHLFGLVTAGIIMIFDFVLIVMKKTKVKGLLEFAIPAAYGIWWLFSKFFSNVAAFGSYSWPPKPTIKGVVNCIIYLCGGNNWQFNLFVIGLTFAVVWLFLKIKQSEFDYKRDYTLLVFVSTPILVFSVNIIASSVLPNSSLFVNRYLIPIIVFFILFIGIAIDMIIEVAHMRATGRGKEGDTGHKSRLIFKYEGVVSLTLTLAFVISSCVITWQNQQADIRDNYKGAAENLMSQNDIYCDSTVCLVCGTVDVNNGFEYYLTKNGKRDSINHQCFDSDFISFDTVYVVYLHYKKIDDAKFIDAGYEKVSEDTSLKIKKFVRKS